MKETIDIERNNLDKRLIDLCVVLVNSRVKAIVLDNAINEVYSLKCLLVDNFHIRSLLLLS